MPGGQCFGRGINEAEVDDVNARVAEAVSDDFQVTLKARLESFELRPIGFQADSKQSELYFIHG